jgi:hypothetical protein
MFCGYGCFLFVADRFNISAQPALREDSSDSPQLTDSKMSAKVTCDAREEWARHDHILLKKVNVYLPSLMMKIPNHLYVLGDTYTCHT